MVESVVLLSGGMEAAAAIADQGRRSSAQRLAKYPPAAVPMMPRKKAVMIPTGAPAHQPILPPSDAPMKPTTLLTGAPW